MSTPTDITRDDVDADRYGRVGMLIHAVQVHRALLELVSQSSVIVAPDHEELLLSLVLLRDALATDGDSSTCIDIYNRVRKTNPEVEKLACDEAHEYVEAVWYLVFPEDGIAWTGLLRDEDVLKVIEQAIANRDELLKLKVPDVDEVADRMQIEYCDAREYYSYSRQERLQVMVSIAAVPAQTDVASAAHEQASTGEGEKSPKPRKPRVKRPVAEGKAMEYLRRQKPAIEAGVMPTHDEIATAAGCSSSMVPTLVSYREAEKWLPAGSKRGPGRRKKTGQLKDSMATVPNLERRKILRSLVDQVTPDDDGDRTPEEAEEILRLIGEQHAEEAEQAKRRKHAHDMQRYGDSYGDS